MEQRNSNLAKAIFVGAFVFGLFIEPDTLLLRNEDESKWWVGGCRLCLLFDCSLSLHTGGESLLAPYLCSAARGR